MIVNKQNLPQADFLAGSMLLIDKPKDWTSFDVVNKVRFKLKYKLGVKKIKVGHAGTLDPLATGLLILCTGKWTKKIESFRGMDKGYSGTIKLGETTPTYDAESDVDATFETEHLNFDLLQEKTNEFIGNQMQVPPIYSAIKMKGQTAYSLARRGKEVVMKPRPVKIHEFSLSTFEALEASFTVKCSKGTYIRSLAYDFGKALGSGAYLSSLRRDHIGDFHVDDAWDLEDLIACLEDY